ncbi:MAG: 3-oxoacyl-[acyl-carrier-protein] reductase [Bacteroidia bacterium]|nr:MAG: 3-oxoacyl-[acyl-carrier-protein] reductase [Bacteroidia bacterium]
MQNRLLEGKNALVTGGSRGIGRAIALAFAQAGANVAFTGTRRSEPFESTLRELQSMGVKAFGYVSDASDFVSAERLVEEVKGDLGGIDILVNNAGITKDSLLMRMSEEQWDEVMRVNLKSAFNLTKAAIGPMMKQKGGVVINMSSVVGVGGNAGQANYSASKAGMIGFTKSLAKELGPRNIRLNAVAPGFILTDMTSALREDIREQWEAKIPLRRAGRPEDVAGVCVFLASDMASYVNGQVINVCGGMTT